MLCYWVGHWPRSLPGNGHKLCSVIRQDHRSGSTAGWSCRLCSAAGQYHRLDSKAVRSHCLRSLVLPGQRLCLTVAQGSWVSSLPGWATGCAPQLLDICGHTSWSDRTRGYAQPLGWPANFSPARVACKMCSVGARHLWSCFLKGQDSRLCLAIGWYC